MTVKKIILTTVLITISLFVGAYITKLALNSVLSSMNNSVVKSEKTPAKETLVESADQTKENNITVNIKNFEYNPQIIKIKKGSKVTWINQDEMQHNAMKEHNEEAPHDASTEYDEETGGFNGPMLKKGESWSFTFDEAGINNYHCAPHPYMKGVVEVVE